MKFNVERRADGTPIVKVTSDAPVVEPFLNFLVEVDSDVSGRQVREFTVVRSFAAILSSMTLK